MRRWRSKRVVALTAFAESGWLSETRIVDYYAEQEGY